MKNYTIFTDKHQNALYIVPHGTKYIGSFYLKHQVLYWHNVQARDEKTARLKFDTIIKPKLTEVSTC